MSDTKQYRAAYFRTTLQPFAALSESAAIVQSAKRGSCGALANLLEGGPISAAIENASPSLFARVRAELAEGQIKPKTASSLLKYLSRMSSRCTPFGLMSGVVHAEIAEGASVDLQVLKTSDWYAFPRISYERTFGAVRQALRNRIERSDDFSVRLSGTLECRDGRIKVMSFNHPSGSITPAFDEIAIDEPLQVVLESSSAWLEVTALAKILSERLADVTVAEARDYVLELLECGVLQDTFYPCQEPRNAISPGSLEACEHDPGLTQVSQAIERASRKLLLGEVSRSVVCTVAERIAADLGPVDSSDASEAEADSLPSGTKAEGADGKTLQIDMLVRASKSSVGSSLVEEAIETFSLVYRLGQSRDTRLLALKDEFVRKFGEDSVPLLRAVAPDEGLTLNGFVSNRPAFLAKLPIHYEEPDKSDKRWCSLDAMMLEKFIEARTSGKSEIVLHPKDLEPYLDAPVERPVRSGYGLFSAYRRTTKDESADPSTLLMLQSLSNSAAGSISARFAHLDTKLEAAYKECFAAERLGDVVDADILYLPTGRMGNVSCRPPALEYQIPIFGYSMDDGCKPIELADLYLRLDQREGFVLTSRKLGKRIRPLLASAHNYSNPECAPVYQFLAMLSRQDSPTPVVDLLSFVRFAGETPSVRLGSLLLTPRTWRINSQQMDAHRSAKDPGGSLRAHLQELGASRFVRFGKYDNLLTCDLESEIYIDVLLEEKELLLQQANPDGYEPACDGEDGLRQVELVLQYVDTTALPDQTSQSEVVVESQIHLSGMGNWNYIKLYGGPHAIDSWVGSISILAEQLRLEKRITAWHFVRYKDPDPHLRVRWRSTDIGDRAIFDQILSSIIGCASPIRISAETFCPEVSRYGGTEIIEAVYDLFTIDSAFVSKLLQSEHASTAEGRVKLGVLSAHALARGMGLDDHEIDVLWDMLTSAFVDEFGGKQRSELRKQLGGQWRNWRSEILGLQDIFTDHLEAYQETLAEALARSDAWGKQMTRSRVDICADVIHMHSNRLFLDYARENEMCSYALAFHLNNASKFRGAMDTRPTRSTRIRDSQANVDSAQPIFQ